MNNKIDLKIDLLIDEYANYVFKIIDNTVPSLTYQDKEEVAADCFYLLWKNQDKITSNVKAYLATIARNRAKEKIRVIHYDNDLAEQGYTPLVDNHLILEEVLLSLTKDEKKLFNLYYVDGYKVKEISSILNKSVNSVKINLYRLRKKIRRLLNE